MSSSMMRPLVLTIALACGGKKAPEPAAEAPPPAPAAEAPAAGDPATTGVEGAAWGAEAVAAIQRPVEARLNDAVAKLTTGQDADARSALDELEALGREAPDLAAIPYNKGVAWMQLADDTQARKEFLRATDIDPTLGAAWLNLGAMAERTGSYDRALQNYRAGLRQDPDNPELVVGVIGALRKLGRHDEAVREAKSALSRNANNINAYNNLGLVYMDQGKVDLALFIYQRALNFIDGSDQNSMIHTNLGRIYLLKGKSGLARLELEKALALDPENVAAMMVLAHLYLDNRDFGATASMLEKARELEPDNAAIRMNLGIAYRGLGRLEESKASYEKALDLDPANPDPYLNLAVLLGDHMRSFDGALQALENYRNRGGPRQDLVDAWALDIQKQKEREAKAAARRARSEQSRKEREKREQLAKEADRLEKERAAKEAADEAARQEAERKALEAAEAAGGVTPAPAAESAWGVAPAEEGSQGATAEPPTATPEPSASAGSGIGTPVGVGGLGSACSAVGTCGDAGLECAYDGICRTAGSVGTSAQGVGCMQSDECARGLACTNQVCASVSDSGGSSPWGGQ